MVDTAITQLGSLEAWDFLKKNPDAVLVDVRTTTEWTSVGIPDLTELDRDPILIQWNTAPFGEHNPLFMEQLKAQVREDQPIAFLCRGGSRSQAAAHAALIEGFDTVINIADGYEGPPGPDGSHNTGGWVVSGLPYRKP